MKYKGSFFDLINSLENVLGGCVTGGIINAFQIGIVPKSFDFACWMTVPDPGMDINDDNFTLDHFSSPSKENGGMEPELCMPCISGEELIPYILHESSIEFYLLTTDTDPEDKSENPLDRKFGWHNLDVYSGRAGRITNLMMPAKMQYLEDIERCKNGEIQMKEVRNYFCGEQSFVVYASVVSESGAILNHGERPEAEFFIRVAHDHPYAHEVAWLAYAIIEVFADRNACKMKTVRPEDQGGY